MELMAICEEDYSGAKPFRRQFLFHRLRLEKPVAAAITTDPLLSMLREYRMKSVWSFHIVYVTEYGNLTDIIKSEEDLPQLLHVNIAKRYEDPINVPFRKRKVE